jgi:hypothetical protein
MSAKNEVALMVRGLGLAMDFIRRLIAKVVERGGYEEMIHFLTTERGEETLDAVADLIVKAPWRVPRSLIERLAMVMAIENDLGRPQDWWTSALAELNIPVLYFGTSLGHPPVPNEIKEQLVGIVLTQGLQVKLNGTEYFLISIGFAEFGQMIDSRVFDGEETLSLVEPRFVDLSR